jgi:branched-chain amino acid transport system substrate-binding protein
MKKKILCLVLSVVFALSILTGCQTGSDSSSKDAEDTGSSGTDATAGDDTISIGTVFNITGYMAAYEEPAANAFLLAVEEINAAGGIDGKQIKYNTINAQSDAAQNGTAATKLIDINGAQIVAGTCDSNLAITAGTAAQDAGKPFLAVGATLPDLPDRVGDGFYLAAYGDNLQAYALAEYAYNDLGARTAYVIEDSTAEYTAALSKYFKERFTGLGGQIVLEDSYDENGYTDYSTNIAKVLALDTAPDVLFFSSFTDQAPIMLQQYRAKGLDMPVLSGDGFDSTTIPEIAEEDSNNVYYSTHVNLNQDSEIVENFKTAYKDKFGVEPENAFAALGYDAMYLIKYAIENYIDGDITAEAIKEAIGKVDGFAGVTGTISYKNGSHVPTKEISLNKYEDGETVFIKTVTE